MVGRRQTVLLQGMIVMNGFRGCQVLLIAGSLLGLSLTVAAAADQDRTRVSARARSQAAIRTSPLVLPRRTDKPRAGAVRAQSPNGWLVYWPDRSYQQGAVRWPLLFVGVGY